MRIRADQVRWARDLHLYLCKLESRIVDPEPGLGLCANFRHYRWHQRLGPAQGVWLQDLILGWPEHAGHRDYPVPSGSPSLEERVSSAEAAEIMYTIAIDMWSTDTAYGRARWRLAAWLRQELEEALPLLDVLEEV